MRKSLRKHVSGHWKATEQTKTVKQIIVGYSVRGHTGLAEGTLAILGFPWSFLVFLWFSLVFDPGDLSLPRVSVFLSPWRPCGPTLWQDSYCTRSQNFTNILSDKFSKMMFTNILSDNVCEHPSRKTVRKYWRSCTPYVVS